MMIQPAFRNSKVTVAAWLVFCLAVASEASACPICIGFPKRTDADHLLEGHCVVLARAHPQDPFQYAPQDVLKGEYDGSNFDLLVDSATRRLLDVHLDRKVLLIQETARGPWLNLGTVTLEFEAVVRRLITVGVGWTGKEAAAHRWQFFMPLFGHTEERIRNLAYLELGRAPYAVIRPMGRTISRDMLAPFLDNRQYIEWQGLAILLLAQSESALDRQRIVKSFQDSMQCSLVTNLSAWVAAAIELDPIGSMQQIDASYFACSERTTEELELVFRAVSMLGGQDDLPLRERIIASYGILLEHRPQFAPQIARDLYDWQRTELVASLIGISKQPHNFDF
jgi:hypothetical protein